MRQPYAIAGALVLFLVAAGVLFGTDFFGMNVLNPKLFGSGSPEDVVKGMSEAKARGGYTVTFYGKDAGAWQLTGGHRLERYALDAKGAVFARLSSSEPMAKDVIHLGVIANLPVELNQQFNGQRVEVGIVTRMPQANASPEAHFVFATRQAGNSGWRKITPTGTFELTTFTYDVPKIPGGYQAAPMIVIHADPTGRGRAIEVFGIYVRQIPRSN